ncbi:MAG: TfoX/Sxy family protein [Candidatus Lokiarchaeota archaeon]|nr:TfoX/Sxy family protein [Candidatus Lokiarchaeota archaeon]
MVYNEKMDMKLNKQLSHWENITKKKMFGGTGYLLNGNMVAGIHKDYYILRLGVINANVATKSPKMELFNMTGRAMKGWVMVEKEAFPSDNELKDWLIKAIKFVETLPPKN